MRDKRLQFLKLTLLFCVLAFLFFGVKTVNAATLYFSPSSGNFTEGNIFTVNILVNTEGVAINNAEAIINFPSNFLEIVSLGKSGSIFSLWVEEPTFSNGAGILSFNGGAPTPGFNGSAGKILSAVFRVKKAGSASLVFSSATVLANDGYGTNVLKAVSGASFNIKTGSTPQPPVASPKIEAPVVVSGFEISSTTHPDQNKWYSNNSPVFKWETPAGVTEVLLVLSRSSGSVPTIRYSPPISERILKDLEEGTWYFNARFRTASGLGPITSFRINIDTQPPKDFTLVRQDTNDTTNPRPELLFESSDATSRIDKYEIKIGDGDWFSIDPALAGKAYALPIQKHGIKDVVVRTTDKAGNSTDLNIEIIVKPVPIPPPFIKEVVLPKTETDKITVIKDEAEVVVKEVVVKEVVVKEVVVKGRIAKEGVSVKVAAVIVDVFKLENSTALGQISESVKNAEKKLIKTVEIPVDKNYNFEAKINDLDSGTYIIRIYGTDERGAISDNFSDVVLKVAGESAFAKFIMGIINAIMRGFDWIVNILSNGGLFMAFLIALAGLILAIIELIRLKSRGLFKRFQLQPFIDLFVIKRAQKKSNKHVEHIIKDIEKELKFLRAIDKRRTLGPEENYLKNKMEQYLKALKNAKKIDK